MLLRSGFSRHCTKECESPADDISGKQEAEEDCEGSELLTHPADLLSGLGGGPQRGAGSFRGADAGVKPTLRCRDREERLPPSVTTRVSLQG